MKTHPVADIFPMMRDEELEALAADIKANGQEVPIILDSEGRILDGRNRFAACKLAGVEPKTVAANGRDPFPLVVTLNLKRRQLTKSQTAIAAAEAAGVSTLKRADWKRLASLFEVSAGYLSHARALVERAPDLAEAVKAGNRPLADAYEELRAREGKAKGQATELDKLRTAHPDLAEQVEAETLTLKEAQETAKERDDALKQQRWAATTKVLDLSLGYGGREPEHAGEFVGLLDPEVAASRGMELDPARLRGAIAFLTAVADELEQR